MYEPNEHVIDVILSSVLATTSAADTELGVTVDPQSELDSHSNMVILGRNAFIFEGSGQTYNVRQFADELGVASNIPIVDGAIAYGCPYSRQTFILIVRNALYIKSMHHNLIPPFIMRAGGVTVNDVLKIHCDDPTIDDHCILFPNAELCIPLQLI